MAQKGFFAKLVSPLIWVNILLMILFVIGTIWGTLFWLNKYTLHGQVIKVPSVKGMTIEQASQAITNRGLTPVIIDSGYVSTLPPGSILEQTPLPGHGVKSKREILLTINSRSTPTVALPDLADNSSYREAEARLLTMGFKVGACEYIDGDKDWVYAVKYMGKEVSAGFRAPIGATLTLVVGDGNSAPLDYESDYELTELDDQYFQSEELEEREIIEDENYYTTD